MKRHLNFKIGYNNRGSESWKAIWPPRWDSVFRRNGASAELNTQVGKTGIPSHLRRTR
jgi:hypothetical protein